MFCEGKEGQHLVRTEIFEKWSRGNMVLRGTSVIEVLSEEFVL